MTKEHNSMQGGMIQGLVSNKSIMEFSPVEKISKMIDFYFPYLIKNLLNFPTYKTGGTT